MKSVVFVLEFVSAIVMAKVFMLLAKSEVTFTSLLAMGLIAYGICCFVLDLIDLFMYAKKKLSERNARRSEK